MSFSQRNKRRRPLWEVDTHNPQELKITKQEVQVFLDSSKRIAGGAVGDASFELFSPVRNISSVKLQNITFVNTIPNVIDGANRISYVVAGSAGHDGTHSTIFTPGNWSAGVGYISSATAIAAPGAYTNDARYAILRGAPSGLFSGCGIDPITGILFLETTLAVGTVTIDDPLNTAEFLGFTLGAEYDLDPLVRIDATRKFNLNVPQAIAIASSTFADSSIVTSGSSQAARSGSYLAVIPVTAGFGDQQTWEPIKPAITRYAGQSKTLNRVNIRLIDVDTGLVVAGLEDTSWKLMLTFTQHVF